MNTRYHDMTYTPSGTMATLFLCLLAISTFVQATDPTVIILGHSANNVYKQSFASRFVPQFRNIESGTWTDFLVFNNHNHSSALNEELAALVDSHNISEHRGLARVGTLVYSQLGTDEMSLDHIALLYTYVKNTSPLLVVEIVLGSETVQTQALLSKGADCWSRAVVAIPSPNIAHLCNQLQLSSLNQLNILISPLHMGPKIAQETSRTFLPSLLVSAAKHEKKHHKQVEVEDDVDEIVDSVMEEMQTKRHSDIAPKNKDKGIVDKKVFCKYRKSCYETGKLPEIDLSFHIFGWSSESGDDTEDDSTPAQFEDVDHDGIPDSEDDDIDLTALKLNCKYRYSCYQEKNIQLTNKDNEREEAKRILASKGAPVQGKKRTLKEIAERTVKKVKEAQEKAANRPLPQSLVVERKLEEIGDKLNEKVECKYRKSCYETGIVPPIEDSHFYIPYIYDSSAPETPEITTENQREFHEMETLEQKTYCKYRKSCYETGVKPDIEPEIQISSFSDLRDLPDAVETRKLTLQERCKFRKSCYETGVLPELNPHLQKVVEKEVSSVVPTNTNDLKLFCKYRRSCYDEIASSATSDVVQNIRKRRMIEREVRKRKLKRAKQRRRLRGQVQLGSYRRPTRKEKLAAKSAEREAKTVKTPEEAPPVIAKNKVKIEPEKVPEKIAEIEEEEEQRQQQQEQQQESPKPVLEKKTKKTKTKKQEHVQQKPVDEETSRTPKAQKKSKKRTAVVVEEVPEVEEPIITKETKSESKEVNKSTEDEELPTQIEDTSKEVLPKPTIKKQKSGKRNKSAPKESTPPETTDDEDKPEESAPMKKQGKTKKSTKPKIQPEDSEVSVEESKLEKLDKETDHQEIETDHKETETDQKGTDSHKEKQQQRDHCKYRKSCYLSGERPIIKQDASTLLTSFSNYVDKSYEESDDDDYIPEDDSAHPYHKLACKYRRSCYESGELPDLTIRQDVFVPPIPSHHKADRKLVCKYRKSCYEEQGINQENDEVTEHEEKRKPAVQSPVPEDSSNTHSKSADKHKEKSTKHKESKHKKKSKDVDNEDANDDDDDKVKDKHVKHEEIVLDHGAIPHLSTAEKFECKYRKSCYVGIKPRATKEDHSGSMARQASDESVAIPVRTKCHIYYLSCREKLGLPPKEKAPIGPNGRRLCRKKKPIETM